MKTSAKLLGIVVVLGVAYVGASWYMGKRAQTVIEQAVVQTNQHLVKMLGPDLGDTGLKVSVTDYRRGVFSSDIVYTLAMKDNNGKPLQFKLADHLQHGPFPIDALRAGSVAPMLAYSRARLAPTATTQKWFDSTKDGAPVVAITKIGFSGQGDSQWEFKPLTYAENGNSIKFSGGKVHITFSQNYKNSTASGRFDSLEFAQASPREEVQIKGILLDSKTTAPADGATHIENNFKADSLAFSSDRDEPVQIQKLAVGFNTQQKGQLLDADLHYEMGQVSAAKADLGSLSFTGRASHVNIEAVNALANQYNAFKAAHGVKNDEDLQLTDAESAILNGKFMDVLASNPSVSVDSLVLKNDKGESTASLKLDLSGPSDKAAAAQSGLETLLPQILKQITLNFSISRPMVARLAGQLQGGAQANPQADAVGGILFDAYAGKLQSAGLAKVDGDKAVAAIKYENNSVEVNGKKMSVMEFAQRAMAVAM